MACIQALLHSPDVDEGDPAVVEVAAARPAAGGLVEVDPSRAAARVGSVALAGHVAPAGGERVAALDGVAAEALGSVLEAGPGLSPTSQFLSCRRP